MAALCPGVKYGLQSRENCSGNKDLIFVKLTDSAFRAIEDYIKNLSKFGSSDNPTIKFLGNEGQLSFPTLYNGPMSFNFSISSTADMEGPGGSFESVQQLAGPRSSLEALGVVPHKIRIHANEDIYEATRQRMTVAEENHKNKCTREIKPNQTDIGRKVKVKQASGRTPSSVPAPRTPPQRDVLKSYQAPAYTKPSTNTVNPLVNGFNHSNSRLQNKPSIPDIARRPIKERLIHLLALRPFKKPELYERLTREGFRERNGLSSVLKQISFLKDNAYHLNRVMWNDVREDWPFYTESEKQMLKRRKPQNLTPPGSSDGGSSGSGHSPTSTHPGSPPPISTKRPGYYDGADGLPTKRQRISHYRKPGEQLYSSPAENISQRRPVTDSRDTSNMNPRSREYTNPLSNGYNGIVNEKHNLSDGEDGVNRNHSCDSRNLSFNVNLEKTFDTFSPSSLSPRKEEILGKADDIQDSYRKTNGVLNSNRPKPLENGKLKQSDTLNNSRTVQKEVLHNNRLVKPESPKENCLFNGIKTTYSDNSASPNEQISTMEAAATKIPIMVDPEFPDYLTEYTIIRNAEQRKKYKADFNAHYAEYRELHAIVEKVSCKFAELEERLKQESEASPKYKDISKQIIREYRLNKRDLVHQAAKRRFQYLHDKLSHVKRLVLEYDQGLTHIRKY